MDVTKIRKIRNFFTRPLDYAERKIQEKMEREQNIEDLQEQGIVVIG